MTDLNRQVPQRPLLRTVLLGLLLTGTVAGAGPLTAAEAAPPTETVRIHLPQGGLDRPEQAARLRRLIAAAARDLCAGEGVAGSYGSSGRRCRDQAVADAERQLARAAARPASFAAAGGQ